MNTGITFRNNISIKNKQISLVADPKASEVYPALQCIFALKKLN